MNSQKGALFDSARGGALHARARPFRKSDLKVSRSEGLPSKVDGNRFQLADL